MHLSTKKTLSGTGTWTAALKVPFSSRRAFEETIADGDWVDIVLSRGPRRYHVMRGIVDAVDQVQQVSSGGAAISIYRVSGFDHQAVFDLSRVWFSTFSEEDVLGGAALAASVLVGEMLGLGGPGDTVKGVLFGFLAALRGKGRNLWKLPDGMPGVFEAGDRSFSQNCLRVFDPRTNEPPRVGTGAALMSYDNQTLWAIAQEWADLQFNELWCDLGKVRAQETFTDLSDMIAAERAGTEGPDSAYLTDDDALEPDQTQMAVFHRLRPFPTAEDPDGLSDGTWARLPISMIHPAECLSIPSYRSGAERVNLIEVLPATVQEMNAAGVPLIQPLIHREDIQYRGARPLQMRSRYLAIEDGQNRLAEVQRRMLRDWHCLNPGLFSGDIDLRTFRPGIRVGSRVIISESDQNHSSDEDLNFYVEGVEHRWNAPGRGSSKLVVTRGYRGTDTDFYRKLAVVADQWELLAPARALEAEASSGAA